VKHAGADAFVRLSRLLEELRSRPTLREKRPGVFYLRSRPFLHFHEDPSGLFADVRLDGAQFTRLPVTTSREQASLLRRIDGRLPAPRPAAATRR
jgi:hypothetical protein